MKGNPDRDAKIVKLWNQGVEADAIATRLGLSVKGLENARARLGLEPRKGRRMSWT